MIEGRKHHIATDMLRLLVRPTVNDVNIQDRVGSPCANVLICEGPGLKLPSAIRLYVSINGKRIYPWPCR